VRILANVAWGWRDGHRLDFFGLQQLDGSDEPRIGSRVTDRNRDKSDADLLWLGGRASGRTYGSLGDLEYFADGAGVGGHETLLQVDDDRERFSGRSSHDVLGFAFDGRATWRTRVPGRPAFTVGYAVGSGDAHRGRGTDHDFRQTGLQLDRDRFRGVDRFPYYGALLRPELSNLQVVTAAVGFRFLPDSSIELLYHVYRQVEPAPVVRGSHLDIDPGGKHADIGQEWDAVLGLREWEHVDLQLIGALFRSGSAFGDRSGSLAEGAFLKFRYNF